MTRSIPTEPIGSIPRSVEVVEAGRTIEGDPLLVDGYDSLFDAAVADTVERFIATGSPIITDGEQRKHRNFITYCVDGSDALGGDGFELAFDAGQVRQLPQVIRGPLRYTRTADRYVRSVRALTDHPVKQAVISPSALSLLYPPDDLPAYPRHAFLNDIVAEHVREVRLCFEAGAVVVQSDFTEGRLALKLDSTGALLKSFIDLNNMALARFTPDERARVGVHTCPGSDCDSHHSADVDYQAFLPSLFALNAKRFYIAMACEKEPERALRTIRQTLRDDQVVYIGVIDPTDPRIETPEEVCERVLQAAQFIPLAQLGTTDDCGFSPFYDDQTTSRETAFAKIKARVDGTRLAERRLLG